MARATSDIHTRFQLPSKDGAFSLWKQRGFGQLKIRQKWHLVTQQHPDVDFRLVFSNQNAKLYKGSPTTYAAYCDKHGFTYANKTIPEEWLKESGNNRRIGGREMPVEQHEESTFVRHEPCEKCGSSDANSLFSDGHLLLFLLQHIHTSRRRCSDYSTSNEHKPHSWRT